MNKYSSPNPTENELVCKWLMSGNKVIGDDTCRRIEYLIDEVFIKIAYDSSGWECLYQDPSDGRYWEHTYPHSEMHGGGPPKLIMLTDEEVKKKYSMDNYFNLASYETEVIGKWAMCNNKMIVDYSCHRIDHLTHNVFIKVAHDKMGWDVLYQDPADGRYWENTYPNGHMQGGGAPKLIMLTEEKAKKKYKF